MVCPTHLCFSFFSVCIALFVYLSILHSCHDWPIFVINMVVSHLAYGYIIHVSVFTCMCTHAVCVGSGGDTERERESKCFTSFIFSFEGRSMLISKLL